MTQGAIYGGYRLLGRLNTGGMAEVFLARSLADSRPEALLALKRILPHFSEDSHFVAMFADEARIAQGLHHPNICEIYDLGEHEGLLYIVMEFIHGKDLHVLQHRAKMRGERIPLALAALIVAQIADALDYSHHRTTAAGYPVGIVHRDVSPPNILVSYDGVPKLIDFGVAKAAFRAAETQAGRIKGKFSYMSPEQARGEPVDGRSDIFSLGIVLYELLTGQLPFPGETQYLVLQRIAAGAPVAAQDVDATLPTELLAVLDRSLARAPQHRYARASAMASDLRSTLRLGGHGASAAKLSAYLRRLFREQYVSETQRLRDLLLTAAQEPALFRSAESAAQSAEQTLIAATPFLAAGYEPTHADLEASSPLRAAPATHLDAHETAAPRRASLPSAPPVIERPVPASERVGSKTLELIALPATDTDPEAAALASLQRTPSATDGDAQRPAGATTLAPAPIGTGDGEVTAPLEPPASAAVPARQRRQRRRVLAIALAAAAATATGLALASLWW